MLNFEEWATSEQNTIPVLYNIKSAVLAAEKFLLNALQVSLIERASEVAYFAEEYILPNKIFINWLSKYGTPIKKGLFYSRSCGQDSCAYFCTNNIVVKITFDNREMIIAEKIKGKLKIVPVVDAVEMEVGDEYAFAIVMKKLETDIFPQHVHRAANILTDTCDLLMDVVKKKPETPVEKIRKRLSLAYFTQHEHLDEATTMCLKDMIRMVKLIYIKSGYLLGADWSVRNLGFDDNKIQAFDYGRAIAHNKARENIPSEERTTLNLNQSSLDNK